MFSNGTNFHDLEWPLTQISRSWYYSTSNNLKTVQDRAILITMADKQKVVYDLSNGAIFKDLDPVSRSRHSMTLNISEYRHNFNGILIRTYRCHTQQWTVISNDFEWPCDTKRRAVSLRQLSFLFTLTLNRSRTHVWTCSSLLKDNTESARIKRLYALVS